MGVPLLWLLPLAQGNAPHRPRHDRVQQYSSSNIENRPVREKKTKLLLEGGFEHTSLKKTKTRSTRVPARPVHWRKYVCVSKCRRGGNLLSQRPNRFVSAGVFKCGRRAPIYLRPSHDGLLMFFSSFFCYDAFKSNDPTPTFPDFLQTAGLKAQRSAESAHPATLVDVDPLRGLLWCVCVCGGVPESPTGL